MFRISCCCDVKRKKNLCRRFLVVVLLSKICYCYCIYGKYRLKKNSFQFSVSHHFRTISIAYNRNTYYTGMSTESSALVLCHFHEGFKKCISHVVNLWQCHCCHVNNFRRTSIFSLSSLQQALGRLLFLKKLERMYRYRTKQYHVPMATEMSD